MERYEGCIMITVTTLANSRDDATEQFLRVAATASDAIDCANTSVSTRIKHAMVDDVEVEEV